MTCALLGFDCSSVSLFWIPFPGFEEYVCSLWSCPLPKKYKCLWNVEENIFFVWISTLPLCADLQSGFYLFFSCF